MKKQTTVSFPGKKLSRNDMKNLNGGSAALLGVWVCVIDDFQCFRYDYLCRANCSKPTGCRLLNYCP
jgi:hypothetical protein